MRFHLFVPNWTIFSDFPAVEKNFVRGAADSVQRKQAPHASAAWFFNPVSKGLTRLLVGSGKVKTNIKLYLYKFLYSYSTKFCSPCINLILPYKVVILEEISWNLELLSPVQLTWTTQHCSHYQPIVTLISYHIYWNQWRSFHDSKPLNNKL